MFFATSIPAAHGDIIYGVEPMKLDLYTLYGLHNQATAKLDLAYQLCDLVDEVDELDWSNPEERRLQPLLDECWHAVDDYATYWREVVDGLDDLIDSVKAVNQALNNLGNGSGYAIEPSDITGVSPEKLW